MALENNINSSETTTKSVETETSSEVSESGSINDIRSTKTTTTIEDYSDKPGFFDTIQAKVISRKFLVWVTTCALLLGDKITPKEWIYISAIYIGMNGVTNLIAILKGAPGSYGEK
ncbi:MAG: hypothetical protein H7831_18185 [Magnetococcus sp. WYHC-3]